MRDFTVGNLMHAYNKDNVEYIIHVDYDDWCENPREWEELGQLYFFGDKAALGDNHRYVEPERNRQASWKEKYKWTDSADYLDEVLCDFIQSDHADNIDASIFLNGYWDASTKSFVGYHEKHNVDGVGEIGVTSSKLVEKLNPRYDVDEGDNPIDKDGDPFIEITDETLDLYSYYRCFYSGQEYDLYKRYKNLDDFNKNFVRDLADIWGTVHWWLSDEEIFELLKQDTDHEYCFLTLGGYQDEQLDFTFLSDKGSISDLTHCRIHGVYVWSKDDVKRIMSLKEEDDWHKIAKEQMISFLKHSFSHYIANEVYIVDIVQSNEIQDDVSKIDGLFWREQEVTRLLHITDVTECSGGFYGEEAVLEFLEDYGLDLSTLEELDVDDFVIHAQTEKEFANA